MLDGLGRSVVKAFMTIKINTTRSLQPSQDSPLLRLIQCSASKNSPIHNAGFIY